MQWASEVASVALIENRPQLAEMWDTGPDAAEMPSQLLTPSPTPVRCVQGASFDIVRDTTCIAFVRCGVSFLLFYRHFVWVVELLF